MNQQRKPRTPVYETPRRLANILKEIRKRYLAETHPGHSGRSASQEQFAKILNRHVRNGPDDKPVLEFTNDTVLNLESRRAPFRFAHLEAIAKACHVRTGWFLLISQNSSTGEAPVDLERLCHQLPIMFELCDAARRQGRSLDAADVFELGRRFRDEGYEVNPIWDDARAARRKETQSPADFSMKEFGDRFDRRTVTRAEVKDTIRYLLKRL